MARPKTAEEYRGELLKIVSAARILAAVDVPEILAMIEHSEAFGCFVDPTLYRQKLGAMQMDKELVEAALPLHSFARKINEWILTPEGQNQMEKLGLQGLDPR